MTGPQQPRYAKAEDCPRAERHIEGPRGYLQWHNWAAEMSKTHRQRKCPDLRLLLHLGAETAPADRGASRSGKTQTEPSSADSAVPIGAQTPVSPSRGITSGVCTA